MTEWKGQVGVGGTRSPPTFPNLAPPSPQPLALAGPQPTIFGFFFFFFNIKVLRYLVPYLESSEEGSRGGGETWGSPAPPSHPPTPFPIFGFTAVVKAWDLVIFPPPRIFFLLFHFPVWGLDGEGPHHPQCMGVPSTNVRASARPCPLLHALFLPHSSTLE